MAEQRGSKQGPEGEQTRPLLSLVLCSRNDSFQGDSLWRLATTLNHAARQAARLGRLNDLELIVSDWGSTAPLRDAVRLSDEAARIVRFLTVPVDLATEKQRDSRFAEVFAINAAARRSHGEYVGRIDQDTLVGRRFLTWFFDAAEHGAPGFPLDASVMISNRRRIPYRFAVQRPPLPIVERYVSMLGRSLPRMGGNGAHYWECYIGILLFHRRLWEECGGYDESFIYYSYMEFDLFLRLYQRYPGVDLGPIVGEDFYHLDHLPTWRSWNAQPRTNNNVVRTLDAPPPEYCPAGPEWGLAQFPLALEPPLASRQRIAGRDMRWRATMWPHFLWVTVASAAATVVGILRENAAERGPLRGAAYTAIVSTGLQRRIGWLWGARGS